MKLFQVLIALAILSGSMMFDFDRQAGIRDKGTQEMRVLPHRRWTTKRQESQRYRQVLSSQRSFAGKVRGSFE